MQLFLLHRLHCVRYSLAPPGVEKGRRDDRGSDAAARARSTALHTEGQSFWGPGDLYTWLVTGEESDGAYFSMLADRAAQGGPPPHIHPNEDETFYVLDGTPTFRLDDDVFVARPWRLRERPQGHAPQLPQRLRPADADDPHLHPAGIEKFFEEMLERAYDLTQECPDNLAEVGARYAEAAPRYGMEFFLDA